MSINLANANELLEEGTNLYMHRVFSDGDPEDMIVSLVKEEYEIYDDDNFMQLAHSYGFSSSVYKIESYTFPVDVEFIGVNNNTNFLLVLVTTKEIFIIEPNLDGSFTFPYEGYIIMMDPLP